MAASLFVLRKVAAASPCVLIRRAVNDYKAPLNPSIVDPSSDAWEQGFLRYLLHVYWVHNPTHMMGDTYCASPDEASVYVYLTDREREMRFMLWTV